MKIKSPDQIRKDLHKVMDSILCMLNDQSAYVKYFNRTIGEENPEKYQLYVDAYNDLLEVSRNLEGVKERKKQAVAWSPS